MARSNKKKKAPSSATGSRRSALSMFQVLMKEKVDDNDGDEDMAPESEWDDRTKALKAAIEGGLESALALAKDDEGSSFEEDSLGDEEDSEMEDDAAQKGNDVAEKEDGAAKSEEESSDEDEGEESDVEDGTDIKGKPNDVADEDESEDDDDDQAPSIRQKNTISSKALRVVTKELQARKSGWDWAETFDVVPSTALPFGKETSIHDDLKREVAFYDVALEAVREAKKKCEVAKIPFSRPDDFFAEMVKTDEHMAKVKDRLIFDNKRIEAVAQRKANKEHMLRAKESKANKQAEKSKRKKDHMRAVEEWASTAAASRGQRLADNDDVDAAFGKSRKRQNFDKKYGHGGPKGRFKQNDPRAQDDFSDYHRSRNSGGNKRKNGGGANRKGKRARDASRSR